MSKSTHKVSPESEGGEIKRKGKESGPFLQSATSAMLVANHSSHKDFLIHSVLITFQQSHTQDFQSLEVLRPQRDGTLRSAYWTDELVGQGKLVVALWKQ